jgi:ADP-dependent NAD(P)H-hydrate dehydratase
MSGPAHRLLDLEALAECPLPAPGQDKESRGRVLVLGGSASVPGAALLAGEAAMRAGAGKLQVATVASVALAMGIALPEAMVIALPEDPNGEVMTAGARLEACAADAGSVLVGPGMAGSDFLVSLIATLSESRAVLVLDAGALDERLAPARPGRPFVLTPHAGELAQLCGVSREQVEQAPLAYATRLAARLSCVVVAKGADTFIVDATGQAWQHRGGVPGLGTSGSGDVLAGLIAGLAARGASALQAALWAVWLHAEAGRALSDAIGDLGFLAREISRPVPGLMARAAGRQDPGNTKDRAPSSDDGGVEHSEDR